MFALLLHSITHTEAFRMFENFLVPVAFKNGEIKRCAEVLKDQPDIDEGD